MAVGGGRAVGGGLWTGVVCRARRETGGQRSVWFGVGGDGGRGLRGRGRAVELGGRPGGFAWGGRCARAHGVLRGRRGVRGAWARLGVALEEVLASVRVEAPTPWVWCATWVRERARLAASGTAGLGAAALRRYGSGQRGAAGGSAAVEGGVREQVTRIVR
jgi:hypothetical protein